MSSDLTGAAWAAALAQLQPRPRRWASPLDMAQEIDPSIVRTPALEYINEALVEVANGAEDRLMVCMPPQEAKSTTVSHRFPEWSLQDDPEQRIIMISYSDEIARRWGADIKRDFEAFEGTDGTLDLGVRLRSDSKAAGRWQVDGHRGGMVCAGIAGSVTGRAAELMLIDDPLKDMEQAQSRVYRERAIRFWQAVAVPRLGPGARCVLVQTRWHEDDLAGYLLKTEGDRRHGGRWRVISIPAIAESDDDPLGRRAGEPLISARGNRDWAGIRASVGEYVWSALYQQRPAPAEGGLFKRLWWRYWSTPPQVGSGERIDCAGRVWPLSECWRFATVDLAASTRTSADWTVASAWAITLDGDLVLLDMARGRVGEDDHFSLVRPLVERWRLDTVYVEATQHSSTLVREAARSGIPTAPLKAETDKFSRALPYSARTSAGRVWLPAGASWTSTWVDEHAGFPNGSHDDMVDTGAYATRIAVTRWTPTPPPPQMPVRAEREMDLMTVPL